ncbi:MAG: hypothetical protein SVR08_01880 [Spirochaetota bacterium]|nr:hypothetical protein [Spirochaetota bacterium]
MYSRYKVKKKNKKRYKGLLLFLILLGIIYFGFRYKKYLIFWEFTYNELEKNVEYITSLSNKEAKKNELIKIIKSYQDYKSKNKIHAKAFILLGKIHFLLGETYLPRAFSELLTRDNITLIDKKARSEFLKAIRYLRKGIILSDEDKNMQSLLLLAKAYFYIEYKNLKDIFSIINKIEGSISSKKKEDIKFFSIVYILNQKEESGLKLLQENTSASETIEDMLFKATALRIAKRYTNSIIEYKKILEKTSVSDIIKLVNFNLGKIYFKQSLYKESLSHLTDAYKIDNNDNSLKIWIGKNYSALGDETRAKMIWGEVVASDHTNIEAKRLLGLM